MLGAEWSTVTPQLVEAAHQRGQRVYAWTVNTMGMLSHVLPGGADVIVTDWPDEMGQAVQSLRQQCPGVHEEL